MVISGEVLFCGSEKIEIAERIGFGNRILNLHSLIEISETRTSKIIPAFSIHGPTWTYRDQHAGGVETRGYER